ncbi:MAG: T9SS type A sorting domain-containing protein [Opitutaceae bacterium]|nr:T9SS type A sorting domain-containing protein [Cytophagales bacterium]
MKQFLLISFLLISVFSYSQAPFGVVGDTQSEIDYFNQKKQILNARYEAIEGSYSDSLPIYDYQVVVHIVHAGEPIGTGSNLSDSAINVMMVNLNKMMSGIEVFKGNIDTKLRFRLADKDTLCKPFNGIIRVSGAGIPDYATNGVDYNTFKNVDKVEALSHWNPKKYVNVWIVTKIQNAAGFANVPTGTYSLDNPGFGIVLDRSNLLNIGHEMGHIFGLQHEDMNCDPSIPGLFSPCATKLMRKTADTYLTQLTHAATCISAVANEALLIDFYDLKPEGCLENQTAKIKIKNLGSAAITSLKFEVYYNNIKQTDINLTSLSIKSDSTKTLNLPLIFTSKGNYKVRLKIAMVNGVADNYTFNNEKSASIKLIPFINGYPFTVDFESGLADDKLLIVPGYVNKASIYTGAESNSSKVLLIDGSPKSNSGFGILVTQVSFCIVPPATGNYALTYDKKHVTDSYSSLGVKVNGVELVVPKDGIYGYKTPWTKDTVDLTAYKGNVIVTFNAATEYDLNYGGTGSGDGVLLDNIKFGPISPAPLKIDFYADNRYDCFSSKYEARSTYFHVDVKGSPQPKKYEWFLDNGSITTGSGVPFYSMIEFSTKGSYNVKLKYTMPDGKVDSIVKLNYLRTAPVSAFEDQNFELKNDMWGYMFGREVEYANYGTWEVTDKAGAYGTSKKSYALNLKKVSEILSTGNSVGGANYYNSTPAIDFRTGSYNALIYDCAFLPSKWFNLSDDSLFVIYGTDCSMYGATKLKTINKIRKLTQTPDYNSFIPNAGQWFTDTVNLDALNGLNEIVIGFKLKSSLGTNALYLDNIRLTKIYPTGIDASEEESSNIQLYPVPVKDQLHLSVKETGSRYRIISSTGSEITTGKYNGGIDVASYAPGLYIIQIETKGGQFLPLKFVKE